MESKNAETVFIKYGPYTVVDTDVGKENGKNIVTPRVVSLCRWANLKIKVFVTEVI